MWPSQAREHALRACKCSSIATCNGNFACRAHAPSHSFVMLARAVWYSHLVFSLLFGILSAHRFSPLYFFRAFFAIVGFGFDTDAFCGAFGAGGFGAAAAVACFARALFEGALDGAGAATAVATTPSGIEMKPPHGAEETVGGLCSHGAPPSACASASITHTGDATAGCACCRLDHAPLHLEMSSW